METESTRNVASRGENFYLHAFLGAVVTVVTSFIPFSPLIGGAVAGYLHDAGTGRGTRVGLVSGLIASLPLAGVFFILFTVMSFGSITTGEFAGPVFVVMLVGAILVVAALYVVGLGAAGGYVGAMYAESRARGLATESFAVDDRVAADEDETNFDVDDSDSAVEKSDSDIDESL